MEMRRTTMSNGPDYEGMDLAELLDQRADLLDQLDDLQDELAAVEGAIADTVEGEECPEDDDEDD
jgi:hypothetical protein